MLTFYGEDYRIAARLAATGTGLDSAVYANMNTVRQMAQNASVLLQSDAFLGVDTDTAASAVLLKVSDGYEADLVADDINIHITKVQATSSRTMIADIADGLGSVSRVIGVFVGVIWILAVVILIAVFALLSNERKKEFAVLRTLGASRKMLFVIMEAEAGVIGIIGAIFGLLIAAPASVPLSAALGNSLDLPFLALSLGTKVLLGVLVLVLSVISGLASALLSAARITKSETGLLLREDA